MPGFFVRMLINILGLWLASEIVDGLEIEGTGTFIAAGLLLGIVNALIRPLAILLTLPFTILTLGIFVLFINAAMLSLVAWMLKDFHLEEFGPAFFGALIVSLTGWVSSWFIGPSGQMEVMVIEGGERR